MRLLLDQNLSHGLVRSLSDVFPDSVHVHDVGLTRADDDAVWAHATPHGLIIVSKDSDFRQRSFLHGAPPKAMLRAHRDDLRAFADDEAATFLALS